MKRIRKLLRQSCGKMPLRRTLVSIKRFEIYSLILRQQTSRKPQTGMRSHALSATDGSQPNIRDSLLKASRDSETKKVPFAKTDMFSPEKKLQTLMKSSIAPKDSVIEEKMIRRNNCPPAIVRLFHCHPDLMMERLANRRDEQSLELLQKQDAIKEPQIQKFEKMELEGSTR